MDTQVSIDSADAVLARVAARYRGGSRFTRLYIRGKLRTDPVHREVLALAGPEGFGDVLDIGCGRGQLGLALLEAGACRRVLGLDRDAAKLAEACRAAAGLRFSTLNFDLAPPGPLPPADTILLVDVLYQLPTEAQRHLLQEAARHARRILVRSLDPHLKTRSWLTLQGERRLRLVLPNSGSMVNPQPIAWISDQLARCGFAVERRPCWAGTPLANVLLDARKEESASF